MPLCLPICLQSLFSLLTNLLPTALTVPTVQIVVDSTIAGLTTVLIAPIRPRRLHQNARLPDEFPRAIKTQNQIGIQMIIRVVLIVISCSIHLASNSSIEGKPLSFPEE